MRSRASWRLLALLLFVGAMSDCVPDLRAATTRLGIEIDGDQVDSAPSPQEDWYPGFPPGRDPFASDDTTLCGTSPAPKNDIITYFLANDDAYLHVGMERLTNNGDTSFFFRFDITGDGPSLGDFIFVFCFGSGPTIRETYVLEWDPAIADWIRDATPPRVDFAVNMGRIAAPFGTLDERGRPSATLDAGRFSEARIRLADIEGFDICAANEVTGVMESKSSCSLSSECKDTTGPFLFSFEPLTADLALAQPPSCEPVIVATANARSPRSTVTYRWFLNGDEITDRDPTWATSDSIRIVLTDECGPNDVRVVVFDGTCTVEDAATIDVSRRPVATIAAASVGACDLTLTYDGSASSGCNGLPIQHLWDFNSDGVVDSTAATGTNVYPGCGDRLVTLVVASGGCLSEPAFALVHVNEPPVAALQVIPDACLAVDFASLSTDCDLLRPSSAAPEMLTQSLDFGDGSPVTSALSGRHEYADCGTYILTLTVMDRSGCTSTATRRATFTGVLEVR